MEMDFLKKQKYLVQYRQVKTSSGAVGHAMAPMALDGPRRPLTAPDGPQRPPTTLQKFNVFLLHNMSFILYVIFPRFFLPIFKGYNRFFSRKKV